MDKKVARSKYRGTNIYFSYDDNKAVASEGRVRLLQNPQKIPNQKILNSALIKNFISIYMCNK